jgi:hypothetical protein
MSEMQSDNRAISAGIPRTSDTRAKSGPMQERFSSSRHLSLAPFLESTEHAVSFALGVG